MSSNPKIDVGVKGQVREINKKVKFSEEDKKYLKQRKEFAVEICFPDLFEYIDQYGLYAGAQTIGSRLFAYEAIKRTINIPGHIVEFGVFKGSNLLYMAKVLRLLQPSTHKLVFGFDTFEGLPDSTDKDGNFAKEMVGELVGNEKLIREAISLYELEAWCHLIVGDAVQTIVEFEEEKPEVLVSLAWIDFDLYEPTVVALDFLSRRLAVGGVIIFDEAINVWWPGETTAMLEFLSESGSHYRMESNTTSRQPTMMIIRES